MISYKSLLWSICCIPLTKSKKDKKNPVVIW